MLLRLSCELCNNNWWVIRSLYKVTVYLLSKNCITILHSITKNTPIKTSDDKISSVNWKIIIYSDHVVVNITVSPWLLLLKWTTQSQCFVKIKQRFLLILVSYLFYYNQVFSEQVSLCTNMFFYSKLKSWWITITYNSKVSNYYFLNTIC